MEGNFRLSNHLPANPDILFYTYRAGCMPEWTHIPGQKNVILLFGRGGVYIAL